MSLLEISWKYHLSNYHMGIARYLICSKRVSLCMHQERLLKGGSLYFKMLKGSPLRGILNVCDGDLNVEAYIDADWAGSKVD